MAVKPAAGEVLEQTTRTRILPQEPELAAKKALPIWDFVETVPPGDWASGEYQFTIYRGRSSQKAEEKTWIGKFQEKISPEIIQSRWGGGEYNVWMKCPPGLQLRYNVDLKIEGEPKAFSGSSNGSPSASSSEIGQVLAMMREDRQMFMAAIERLSGAGSSQEAIRQALALNGQVFGAAVPAVVRTLENAGGSNNPSSTNPLVDRLLEAAIAKLMNPADPIESFSKMATAMGSLGFKMGGNPSGGFAVEVARGLINALPQLAAHVGGIMDQYRRAEEAKMHQAALLRGAPGTRVITAPASPAAPEAPAPASNVIEMPAAADPAAAAPAHTTMTPEQTMQAEELFQFVESKVAELLLNTDLTPEEAANDALTFIDVTDKNLVDELLRHGENGLRWAFANRPILKNVPAGPRLDAFIAEFVKNGRKVAVPIPLVPDPNIPPA